MLSLQNLVAILNEDHISQEFFKIIDKFDIPETLMDLNQKGMIFLNNNQFKSAFKYLRAAEKLAKIASFPDKIHHEDRLKMLALTLNNIGCYYKKLNKPKVALWYMQDSLNVEKGTNLPKSHIASTKLNICAILSRMERHQEAVAQA